MVKGAPSIMIVAGEASGDLHGASLAAELKQMLPSAAIRGVGGRRMCEAGVELLYDSSSWSAIGITEALKLVPRLLFAFSKLQARLRAHPPDVLILIDFGAFNVRLGRRLHATDTKVLCYFPPSSWYRDADYSRLSGIADRVVTPFPWSVAALKRQGFQADFFGHPLLDVVRPSLSQDVFHERFEFDAERPIIALLPGSRIQEITHNLPALLIAAARVSEEVPELQFAIPLAPTLNASVIADELGRVPWIDIKAHDTSCDPAPTADMAAEPFDMPNRVQALAREEGLAAPAGKVCIHLLPGMAYDLLACSRAAVITSGTATVEAVILDCPMVIVYRGSRLATLEFKLRRKRIKFVGMPNIILDKAACPELIADEASPGRISELLLKLIPDSPERARMLKDLAEARAVLGEPGAVQKTARVVLELLGVDTPVGSTESTYAKDNAS